MNIEKTAERYKKNWLSSQINQEAISEASEKLIIWY